MANRVPIDLSEIRERIENARSDSAWKELSLSKKARILLQERLDQIERERSKMDKDETPTSGSSSSGKGRGKRGDGDD